jgi:hypothetical protein
MVLKIILDAPAERAVYIERVLPPLKKNHPIRLINVPRNK